MIQLCYVISAKIECYGNRCVGNLVIQLVLLYKQLNKLIPKLKLISQGLDVCIGMNENKCVVL